VAIAAIGRAGLAERRDGAGPVLQLFPDVAEREPGGRKVRRDLQRLEQKLGGRRPIACLLMLARPVVAPVGDQIAGRGEQRRAGRHRAVSRRVGNPCSVLRPGRERRAADAGRLRRSAVSGIFAARLVGGSG